VLVHCIELILILNATRKKKSFGSSLIVQIDCKSLEIRAMKSNSRPYLIRCLNNGVIKSIHSRPYSCVFNFLKQV
jgi:hypothetical protein